MAINIMNVVIKEFVFITFDLVYFPTESHKQSSLSKWTFIAQFINMGFLLMLLIANFEGQNIPFMEGKSGLFHEEKTDFDV